MNQYVDLFIVIYDLHRQKRGVPCSDRLEQVERGISYKGSQQKLLCRWKSTSQNNLTFVSSRNEVAYCWLSNEHYCSCSVHTPKQQFIHQTSNMSHFLNMSDLSSCLLPQYLMQWRRRIRLDFQILIHNWYRPGSKTLWLKSIFFRAMRGVTDIWGSHKKNVKTSHFESKSKSK